MLFICFCTRESMKIVNTRKNNHLQIHAALTSLHLEYSIWKQYVWCVCLFLHKFPNDLVWCEFICWKALKIDSNIKTICGCTPYDSINHLCSRFHDQNLHHYAWNNGWQFGQKTCYHLDVFFSLIPFRVIEFTNGYYLFAIIQFYYSPEHWK